MPGSWDQGSRKLIGEIRETLRQHFKGVHTAVADLEINNNWIAFHLPIDSETYGGVLIDEQAVSHPAAVLLEACSNVIEAEVDCVLHQGSALVPEAVAQAVPCNWEDAIFVRFESTAFQDAHVITLPVEAVAPGPVQCIERKALSIAKAAKPTRLENDRFKRPAVKQLSRIKTQPLKFAVQAMPLPVYRKPIPPHRFSTSQRVRFKELLSQKAKLPINDIQLVSIYDRVYLGLYQSISQADDGTLMCLPKPVATKEPHLESYRPVYLIIGKSLTPPHKYIQTVMLMTDEEDGR